MEGERAEKLTLGMLAVRHGCELQGDPDATVDHVATLARLDLSEAEADRLTGQLDRILEYVHTLDALGTLDVTEVPPTSHALATSCPLREDVARPSGQDDALLERAPDRVERYFRVPKVID